MKVEVWSDVVCPWCYIGKRRFESAVEAFEAETGDAVEVRFRPFMLDPSAPSTARPVLEVYERKFGGPDAARQLVDRVTAEASGVGLDFRMNDAKRANTLPAHRLLVLAERHGSQAELKERLLHAYFAEGADIGDRDVLVGQAESVGIDSEVARSWLAGDGGRVEVATSLEFAAANGITSVPTYVFDRRVSVPGAQPPEVFVRVLQQVHASDGPEQLIEPD